MLIRYILKTNPWKETIKIQGISYKKSEHLRRIDYTLHFIRFFVAIGFAIFGWILLKKGVNVLGIDPYDLVLDLLFIGFLVMYPVHLMILPKPITDYITPIE